jgi:hypothetical protein
MAAAWANELDQVKALVDRAVVLYQTLYTGAFMQGHLCTGRSRRTERMKARRVVTNLSVTAA